MEELADQLEAPLTPEQTAALSPLVSLPMGCTLLWFYILLLVLVVQVCVIVFFSVCFLVPLHASSASSAGMIGQKGNKGR